MPKFGSHSRAQLASCDSRIQRVFNEVIKHWDCTVLEGHRSVARQKELYAQGRTAPGSIVTQLDGVTRKGMHNYSPSLAVDVVPYPVDFNNTTQLIQFAGFVLGVAAVLDVPLRWGGDWDSDRQQADERFRDMPHFELP